MIRNVNLGTCFILSLISQILNPSNYQKVPDHNRLSIHIDLANQKSYYLHKLLHWSNQNMIPYNLHHSNIFYKNSNRLSIHIDLVCPRGVQSYLHKLLHCWSNRNMIPYYNLHHSNNQHQSSNLF